MLDYVLVVTLVLLCGVFRWKHRRFYQLSRRLGSDPRSLPLLGIAHLFIGSGEVLIKSLQTLGRNVLKNQGILSMWLAHHFFVVIADPVVAEHVSKTCLEKDDIMKKCFKPFLGNSNLIGPVPIWRIRRKNLMLPFNPLKLKQFVKVFTEQSEILADKLRPSLGQPIALLEYFMKYSTETVCQSTFGVQLDVQNTPHHPFVEGLETMSYLTGERFLKPWLQVDCFYKLLPCYRMSKNILDYANNFINEKIYIQRKRKQEETESNEATGSVKSLLEQLLHASGKGGEYSDLELREETFAITVAGVDTSAITAGFVAAMLARHPDVQEKVYTELLEIFDNDEPVTTEHLPHMKYLDAVIKETLRLFPPVPIITRQADKDCPLPSGVVLPKGCGILLHLWAINRHPDYWGPDADEFRPERFLETSAKHPAQFSAFSLGPRNCVGYKYALMSVNTLFATLLRRYRLLPAGDCACDQLRLSYGVTLKDVDLFTVKLAPR